MFPSSPSLCHNLNLCQSYIILVTRVSRNPSVHSLRERAATCRNEVEMQERKPEKEWGRSRGVGLKASTAARDIVGHVASMCSASFGGVIPADTHAETCLSCGCVESWRRFLFFSGSLAIFVSLCIQHFLYFQSPQRLHSHSLLPEPLAAINSSIVTVTAEHMSYACLFRVEDLIMTSQLGPCRQQYIWCTCDIISEMHANALYDLYSWILPFVAHSAHVVAGKAVFYVYICFYRTL